MTTLKYNLESSELQEIADKLQTLMKTKYKDELTASSILLAEMQKTLEQERSLRVDRETLLTKN